MIKYTISILTKTKGSAQGYKHASSLKSQVESNPFGSCKTDGYLCTILPHAKQALKQTNKQIDKNLPNSWRA